MVLTSRKIFLEVKEEKKMARSYLMPDKLGRSSIQKKDFACQYRIRIIEHYVEEIKLNFIF